MPTRQRAGGSSPGRSTAYCWTQRLCSLPLKQVGGLIHFLSSIAVQGLLHINVWVQEFAHVTSGTVPMCLLAFAVLSLITCCKHPDFHTLRAPIVGAIVSMVTTSRCIAQSSRNLANPLPHRAPDKPSSTLSLSIYSI